MFLHCILWLRTETQPRYQTRICPLHINCNPNICRQMCIWKMANMYLTAAVFALVFGQGKTRIFLLLLISPSLYAYSLIELRKFNDKAELIYLWFEVILSKEKVHDDEYIPFVVIIIRSFPHLWLITWIVTRVTRRVSHVEQKLTTFWNT